MKKALKIFFLFIVTFFIYLFVPLLDNTVFTVFAGPIGVDECQSAADCLPNGRCLQDASGVFKCSFPRGSTNPIPSVFGKITPPDPIQQLGFGALGISTFLSNLVTLIYSLAIVVLIFMILWGAWDWMTSEGDKEKLESAKRKLINAFIGIIFFAIAFAAIRILGTFTGFKFFAGQ